jgi:hypothetical protein
MVRREEGSVLTIQRNRGVINGAVANAFHSSWRRARELGLKFEATTFERRNPH